MVTMKLGEENLRKARSDKGKKRQSSKEHPDRVFTFRLSPDNQDENRIIDVIDNELGRGIPLRDVICSAFRKYKHIDRLDTSDESGIDGLMDRLQSVIDRLLLVESVPDKKQPKEKPGKFNVNYLQNLKKAMNGDDE